MSFSASVVGFSVEVSGEEEAARAVLLLVMLAVVMGVLLKRRVEWGTGREEDRQRLEQEEGEEGVDGGRRQAMLEGVMTTSMRMTRRGGMACSCRECCGWRSGSDEGIAGVARRRKGEADKLGSQDGS